MIDYTKPRPPMPTAAEKPTMSIPEAGWIAYGLRRGGAYQVARDGGLPVLKISDSRLVVPTSALRRFLHMDDAAVADVREEVGVHA